MALVGESADVTHSCRALMLDFNGVLTSDLFAAYRTFCADRGLPPDSLFDVLTSDPAGHNLLVLLETGRIEQPEFEQAVGRLLGIDGTGMIQHICRHLEPETELLGFVERLRLAGVRTGVISNSLGLEPFNPYEPWNLRQRFDAVILSGEHGVRKPEPEIFMLTANSMGVPCEQCVFVDDMPHNLEPARALGITALHHTSSQETIENLRRLFAGTSANA